MRMRMRKDWEEWNRGEGVVVESYFMMLVRGGCLGTKNARSRIADVGGGPARLTGQPGQDK